jgi:hypothetical protein
MNVTMIGTDFKTVQTGTAPHRGNPRNAARATQNTLNAHLNLP